MSEQISCIKVQHIRFFVDFLETTCIFLCSNEINYSVASTSNVCIGKYV